MSDEIATPAATVIILRDVAPPEFLMIQRASTMGFAGGAMAFPGGKVDAGDRAEGVVYAGFDGLDGVDAAARIAAAREAFEEAGILLSAGPTVSVAARASARTALVRHERTFGQVLAGFGHSLSADVFRPFARWVPPPGLHRRFDTHFYLARLPDGEEALEDGDETTAARWVTADGALADHLAGRGQLLFPTRCNVERLGQFSSLEALWNDATPMADVQPRVAEVAGEMMLIIPDGIGYPVTRRPLSGERRA
ncbi:NUDIX hydrolase [Sandaracinobacteroides saxicola]|uniref:NUDIX domain-containing protein n=1 Tax=Sandaracinobacteroides saxicola TaxID=2759707 RepID=A0A7G5IGC9_9SPHN|nr:NUDIX domain-containing protein [Sandaracinobacteroides saxicola]QMW22421.1 NUDIX domain-containing protein [Sandaracinobacteroides saxicola]